MCRCPSAFAGTTTEPAHPRIGLGNGALPGYVVPPEGAGIVTEFSFFARGADFSVAEIAALTGAEPCEGADLSRRVTGIAPVDQATATDLTFVSETKFVASLRSTEAGVVLTTERFVRHAPKASRCCACASRMTPLSRSRARFTAGRCVRRRCSAPSASRRARWCIPRRSWEKASRSIRSR